MSKPAISPDTRRDFNGEARLLRIASMAAGIGVLSTRPGC